MTPITKFGPALPAIFITQVPGGIPAGVTAYLRLDDPVNETHVRFEWKHSGEYNVPLLGYTLESHHNVSSNVYSADVIRLNC